MSTTATATTTAAARQGAAVWAGAGAGLALAGLAVYDQTLGRWTAADFERHYSPWGLAPDPDMATLALAGSALLFGLLMLLAGGQARGGHRGRAAVTCAVAAVVSAGIAAAGSFAAEYGGAVFIPLWRTLPWLLPAAAVAGCVLVLRGRASGRPLRQRPMARGLR